MYRTSNDDLFAQALRAGGVQTTEVFARRGGFNVLTGGMSLPLLGGSIPDAPGDGGVRRTLNLEVADTTGELYDALAPTGTTLHPFTVVQLSDDLQVRVPMGVFDVDVQRAQVGPSGGMSLTAPDGYARIQRARLLAPYQSQVGVRVTQQIADLIRHGLGYGTAVLNYSRSEATVPNALWDEDRAKAIEELAAAAGVHVGVNRDGVWEIRDLPTLSSNSDWLVDASPTGVLLSGERERSRRGTANVVRVTGETADANGVPFSPVIVWDLDPASPTYAGPDPINRPDLAGPFGVVPYFYSSPLIQDAYAAEKTAKTILARTTGLASQLNLSAVRNPALDAFDVIDVLPPRRRPEDPLTVERHIVESVTHPLTPSGEQSITGRSSRSDQYQ